MPANRQAGWLCLLLLLMSASAAAQREPVRRQPVLAQIDVPHSYYYREMYLPQLTTGPSSVAWSPDGRAVVYSMAGTLWRQQVGTTVAEQLTDGPGYHYQPDWSPDGKWIAFAAYDRDAVELRALEVATGRIRALTTGGAVNVEPRFSPDGARLAWVSTQFNRRFHIFVAEFREGQLARVERLTGETRHDPASSGPRYYYSPFDHEISPAWSPDGREILFVSNRGHIYGTGGLWRMPAVPGAEAKEIHAEETTWKARPEWSPDGKRVVFSSYHGRQWHQLWVTTAAAGGALFPITYGEYDNTAPRWSPDGRTIAFISNRDGNTALWFLDAVGGAQRPLEIRQRKYRAAVGKLRIRVVDARGVPVPARVSVTVADGRAYAPDKVWMHADDAFVRAERTFEAHYFHTRGTDEVTVPAGRVEVEAMRGFEHSLARRTVDVPASATDAPPTLVTLRLTRLKIPAPQAGDEWLSGDVHIHMNYGGAYRNTPANLVRQGQAENLPVLHNLIVNKEQRIPDVDYFRGGQLDPASTANTLVLHGQEFHTSFWGHLGLLGLRRNLLLPDYAGYPATAAASLYPSNDVIFDLAHAQGAVGGYVHPYDDPPDPSQRAPLTHTLPVDAALGKVDYMEILGFDDPHFTAAVWYRLLNCGFRIAAAGGTDAMANFASVHGPVGLSRVYVRLPAGPMTAAKKMDAWLAGLRAGRSFATNAPLLGFSLDGKQPGDEVRLAAGRAVPFRAWVRSIVPLEHAEIVCNGRVVRELPLSEDRHSADATGTLPLETSGWCVLRAWNSNATHPVLDLYPYGTTSAVYVNVAGAPLRSPADAAFFVAWIDRILAAAEAHTDWNTPAEREHALQQLRAARAIYAAMR